jgi:hypothetical protein
MDRFFYQLGGFQRVPDGEDPADYGLDASAIEAPADCETEPYKLNEAGDALVEDVATAQAQQWEMVRAYRDERMASGCETPKGRMDTDPDSIAKLTGAVVTAQIVPDFSVDWTMADNSTVTHSGADIIAAGLAASRHVAACHAVGVALRAQIDAAATNAEVRAVDPAAATWPD